MDSNSPAKRSYLSVRILMFIALTVVISVVYYFIEYERYYVSNEKNDKYAITLEDDNGCAFTINVPANCLRSNDMTGKIDNMINEINENSKGFHLDAMIHTQ